MGDRMSSLDSYIWSVCGLRSGLLPKILNRSYGESVPSLKWQHAIEVSAGMVYCTPPCGIALSTAINRIGICIETLIGTL